MKKALSCILILCLLIPFCFASCAKKEIGGASGESSDIPYIETSSDIAKTEEGGEFTFAFDPYVLPQDVKKLMGTTTHYRSFVNAVIAGEDSVSVPSRDDYDNIRFAIGENFPFAALISSYRYDSANSRILISYEYQNTHNDKIKKFENAVQDVFDACVKNTDDDVIAAISLYSWLAQNIEIEEEKAVTQTPADLNSSEIASTEAASSETNDEDEEMMADIYNTLIEEKGTASSVAALYNFLLMQLGIECKTVSSWNSQSYKTWNMVELDSKWYHCDIASEQKETEGEGLKFFGVTEQIISQNVNENEIYSGQWKWFTNDIPKATSPRFEDFANIVSWEMNTNRDGIVAFTDEYSRFSWNITD